MTVMLVPDEIEPRIGWRGWTVAPNGRLRSLNGATWVPGRPLHARCNRGNRHAAPHEGCRCGIYAAGSLEWLIEIGYGADRDLVIGSVSLWGSVMVADNGFRAEFAYPKKLYVHPLDWRQAKVLEESYGVPTRIIQRRMN